MLTQVKGLHKPYAEISRTYQNQGQNLKIVKNLTYFWWPICTDDAILSKIKKNIPINKIIYHINHIYKQIEQTKLVDRI